MPVVTLLHPGAMGAAVGRQAVSGGATVRWFAAGRSAATRKRADDAGLDEYNELAAALDGADIVLSICPPAHAEDVAREVAGYTGVYVDANAIAPARGASPRCCPGRGWWTAASSARRPTAAAPPGCTCPAM